MLNESPANTTDGLDRSSIDGDNDDRFKRVFVKSTVFVDHNTGKFIPNRLRRLLSLHVNAHDRDTIDSTRKNPIRIYQKIIEESLCEILVEEEKLTKKDIDTVEKHADKLFHSIGVDVTFTRHFLDRANDPRNGKQITVHELITLFNKQYQLNGIKIKKMPSDSEIVLKDLKSDINSPVYLEYDRSTKMLELRAKTVMRKKNFTTPDKVMQA